ncbi:hypothetical protein ACFVYR_37815 [Streptomyces sp. NPDC058284]|uniref:hypothetical protein n=1 Tax=unclassified Streptomyces TaxID=2593676 RepID=UPI003646D08A
MAQQAVRFADGQLLHHQGEVSMNHTRLRIALVSTVCAAAVGISGIGVANAATVSGDLPVASAAVGEVTQDQINELSVYLEAIYDGKINDAEGKFDYEKTRSDYGAEFANALAREIAHLDTSGTAPSQRSYASCLLNGVGLGGLLGSSSAIVKALEGKEWKKAAQLITKEAVKRGIKIGVKGGVVGLAAALGGYAVWCAMPWS